MSICACPPFATGLKTVLCRLLLGLQEGFDTAAVRRQGFTNCTYHDAVICAMAAPGLFAVLGIACGSGICGSAAVIKYHLREDSEYPIPSMQTFCLED